MSEFRQKPLAVAVLGGIMAAAGGGGVAAVQTATAANPCAAKRPLMIAAACNPCNPCAAKKCNPCNPCAAKKCNPCNPCAAKKCNPCAAKGCNPCNPCAAKVAVSDFVRPGGKKSAKMDAELVALGQKLWADKGLSTNGLACGTCHEGGAAFSATFAEPYPHRVAMPEQMAGVKSVSAEEMVQFCMLVPMANKALPWNSRELAALSAYSVSLQKSFNPCAAKKAGGGCNPCNPCAAKKCNPCNPCAAKKCNPCNPCAAKKKGCNPCNPCAAKKG